MSYIVAVAAPVGGGKSTLVQGVARRLADASVIQFDHYKRNYLGVVRVLLRIQRDTVGANADLVVSGEGDADMLARQVEREIRRRLT